MNIKDLETKIIIYSIVFVCGMIVPALFTENKEDAITFEEHHRILGELDSLNKVVYFHLERGDSALVVANKLSESLRIEEKHVDDLLGRIEYIREKHVVSIRSKKEIKSWIKQYNSSLRSY